jgi:tetratricopeptide (TPR) repeat protein
MEISFFAHYALEPVLPVLASVEVEGESDYRAELAAVYNGLAQAYWNFGRWQDMKTVAIRAEELARAQGNDAQLVEALHWRSLAAYALGELRGEEWLQELLALIPLAERGGDLWLLCRTCANVAWIYRDDHGNFELAATYLERALEAAERRGGLAVTLDMQAEWMELHYYLGEWDRVQEHGRQANALRSEEPTGATPWSWYHVLLALGTLDLAQGRHQQAEEHLEQAIAFDDTFVSIPETKRHVQRLLAERDLVAGQAAAAHARLQPLLDRPGMREVDVPPLLPILAWAQLALDRDDEAAATLAACRGRCGKLWLVDALRVEALLAIKQQRWQDGAAALDKVLETCRAMPYAKAKALYVYGQLLHTRGEPQQAHEKYQAALTICERLGEGLYRPHIERALATLTPDGE